MNWLLILGAVVAIFLLVHLITIYRLATFRLLPGNIEPIEHDEVPDEVIHVVEEAITLVKDKGFEFSSFVKREAVIEGHPWGIYGAICFNPVNNTWALVYVEPMKQPGLEWRLLLVSRDDSSNFIVTLSGNAFKDVSYPTGYKVKDAMTLDHAKQLEFHEKRRINPSPENVDVQVALEAMETAYFKGLVDQNIVVPWKNGYRLPVKQSVKLWQNQLEINKRFNKQIKQSDAPSKPEIVRDKQLDSADRQLTEYQSYKSLKEKKASSWLTKTLILLGSVILFSVSFGMSFSLDWLLMLIVVLFIHEAGHLFGMWLFGYRDLKMLFIPFLGAMASGKKERVNSFQEAIILLLGPVPGYVLGIVLLSMDGEGMPKWVAQYAILSLILNALNLLPFNPLDGGKIVSLALFNRLPALQLLLTLMSIFAFGYMGLGWDEHVALIIAVFLVVALPFTWKESQLLRHLIKSDVHKKEANLQRLIELLAKHPVWIKQTPQNRWPLLDSLVYRVQHASSGVITSVVIFTLWIGSIVLPPVLIVSEQQRNLFTTVASEKLFGESDPYPTEDMVEEFENADTSAVKADAALNLSLRLSQKDKELGAYYWEQAHMLLDDGSLTPEHRGDLYMRMNYSCSSYEESCGNRYLFKALDLYERNSIISSNRAVVYLSLVNDESIDEQSRLEYAEAGEQVASKAKHSKNLVFSFNSARSEIYESNQDLENAEQYLARNIQQEAESDLDVMPIKNAYRELANFYIRHSEKAKAIGLLKGYLEAPLREEPKWTTIHEKVEYWLAWLLVDSDPHTAKAYLNKLEPQNVSENIEIQLAHALVDERLGSESSGQLQEKVHEHVSDIEDIYEVAMLYGYLEANDKRFAIEEFDSEQLSDQMSEPWYRRMAEVVYRPEYSFLLNRLDEYRKEFKY